MREVVLGTAGHVDHGKTSFVKALTGIDTDRLKEEKARGITIELGFAYLDLPCGHRLGIVDVPGHERFVKNMVAGAAGIDLVAFIVAADEGIMPQTREHFEICKLLGVKRGLVVITKKDMVEPDWLALVQEEVRSFLAGSFLAEAPMVAVSAVTGEGLGEARTVIDRLVRESDFAEAYGPFRLPVDRVFTMKGFGVVVTGSSISGRIKTGEEVVFYPSGVAGRIRGIQVHGAERQEVEAGNRTAINVQGVEKEQVARGDVLASPGCLQPSLRLDADFLYLSSNDKPLKNRARVRLHLGTAEIMARVVVLAADEIAPGSHADVQLLLEEPASVWPGDHYVIRSYSPVATIGGGVIWNCSPPRRRRHKESNQRAFALYRSGSQEELALFHLEEAGLVGLPMAELAVKLGLFGKRLKKVIDPLLTNRRVIMVDSERQRLIAVTVLDSLGSQVEALLAEFHRQQPMKQGLPLEELRSRLHRALDQRLFQLLLADLCKRGITVLDTTTIRLASHQVSLAADAEALRAGMLACYREAGLAAPTVKEVRDRFATYPAKLVQEVQEVLVREGLLVKVSEDLYFDAAALAALKEKVAAFIKKEGEIDAPRFKDLTGLTRKFSIPLLEYFDKTKLTIRVGDKRILRDRSA
ncbi:MAG: selenocysteine-specific translation elongation factor [Thermodesulfobacteriota bacterium]